MSNDKPASSNLADLIGPPVSAPVAAPVEEPRGVNPFADFADEEP